MTLGVECLVAGGAECFAAGDAEHCVTGGAECFVAGVTECFVGTFLVVLFACCHPNLPHVLLHSSKWGNEIPMSTFLQLAWA